MVKRFHGSRRFIFTGSWSATHVLLSFVFLKNRFHYEKQAIRRRQFAAIDCDVFMCGSYRIAGSELHRGLGAYGFFLLVRPFFNYMVYGSADPIFQDFEKN